MQIVIDISEEAYNLLKRSGVDWSGDKFVEYLLNAVANGTRLPKDTEIDADKESE